MLKVRKALQFESLACRLYLGFLKACSIWKAVSVWIMEIQFLAFLSWEDWYLSSVCKGNMKLVIGVSLHRWIWIIVKNDTDLSCIFNFKGDNMLYIFFIQFLHEKLNEIQFKFNFRSIHGTINSLIFFFLLSINVNWFISKLKKEGSSIFVWKKYIYSQGAQNTFLYWWLSFFVAVDTY